MNTIRKSSNAIWATFYIHCQFWVQSFSTEIWVDFSQPLPHLIPQLPAANIQDPRSKIQDPMFNIFLWCLCIYLSRPRDHESRLLWVFLFANIIVIFRWFSIWSSFKWHKVTRWIRARVCYSDLRHRHRHRTLFYTAIWPLPKIHLSFYLSFFSIFPLFFLNFISLI